jgi:hypothetical protein
MRSYIIVIVFAVVIVSCKKKDNTEIIEVNPLKEYITNNQAKVKSFIKLETTDSCLIGEINNLEFFNDKFYILDKRYSKSLLIFNRKGEFIKKTVLGKGPGEMSAPRGFTINKENKEILVWDMNLSSFFTFDLDLNFKHKIVSRNLIRDFVILDDNKIFAHSFKIYDEENFLETEFAIYKDSFQTAEKRFLIIPRELELEWYNKIISQLNSRVLFIGNWDYNVYELLDDKIESRYFWDFGKYQISDTELVDSYREKWDKVENGKMVGALCDLVESNKYISVSVFYKNDKKVYFYSKKQKELSELLSFVDNNQLPKLRVGNIIDGDTFVGIVKPKDFLVYESKFKSKIMENVNEIDNPILVLFKITE